MRQAKWYIHPVLVFTFSIIALAISLFLYIYSYVTVSSSLKAIVNRYQLDPNQFFELQTWVVILVLSILVGIILVGILTIFYFNLKSVQLYRLQHTFINNFTHELKTPVTSIKIFLETFARHEIAREEQLKYIGFMLQDVERLSNNINSILNVARIESKVFNWEFTAEDARELVRNFVAENSHVFRNCDISIGEPPGHNCIVPLSVPLFDILLMNLITNSIKYNNSERPRIDITFARDGKFLLIRFSDNGIGIEKNEMKHLFRKFYQGPRRGEHVPAGGSGIGLYLVQQIAKAHRGKMVAESEGGGKGSVFTLSLPFLKVG